MTTNGAGAITIVGDNSGNANSAGSNYGVSIGLGAVVESTPASGGGAINVSGIGGGGTSDLYGVYFNAAGTRVSSASGAVTLAGTGGSGTSSFNHGVHIIDSAQVTGTGSAPVTIVGTGGSGLDQHFAVNVDDRDTPVRTAALSPLGIDPERFAKDLLAALAEEVSSVVDALGKVRPAHGAGGTP